jgi:hypothetical protein
LKDNSISQDIGSSLIDVLGAKMPDVLAQQRARRQFEAIGERVAESLLPIFEETSLDENSKQAVAIAVAQTVEESRVDSRLLIVGH